MAWMASRGGNETGLFLRSSEPLICSRFKKEEGLEEKGTFWLATIALVVSLLYSGSTKMEPVVSAVLLGSIAS